MIWDKRILLVDDDPAIINMLEIILKKEQFKNIYKAMNGRDAIQMQEQLQPNLIVLDIMLPDIDGYEVCKNVRGKSMVPILFLSAKTEELDKLVSYAMGGDEYITKPFSTKELVAKITAILKRQEYYENPQKNENLYHFGEYSLYWDTKVLKKADEIVPLTAKEYAVLEYLVLNENVTISKEKLVENVWGCEYDGYDNTVMVHIHHLREKIEDNPSQPRFIKNIKGRGYVFENTM